MLNKGQNTIFFLILVDFKQVFSLLSSAKMTFSARMWRVGAATRHAINNCLSGTYVALWRVTSF